MKTTNLFILCLALFLQCSNSFAQTTTEAPSLNNSTVPLKGHLITFTADYNSNAISIFYPDRTELIYVKIRKSRWIKPNNTYSQVSYDVIYEDGTRKHFEDVKLFRRQDVMQRVVTDHLSKITELGYELIETNMIDFDGSKYLTSFFRFKG